MEKKQGRQDRAKRKKAHRAIKAHIIQEYHRQDMSEEERAEKISNLDSLVSLFLSFMDVSKIALSDEGIVFKD